MTSGEPMVETGRRAWRATLRSRWLEAVLLLGFIVLVGWFLGLGFQFWPEIRAFVNRPGKVFNGDAAMLHVEKQLAIGPRHTGSRGNRATSEYIAATLRESGWNVELQGFSYRGVRARNVLGKAGSGPLLILGAHFDSRLRADRDPDPAKRTEPVPGGNDGASGVAVLLELARSLDKATLKNEVWLAFFDAEDNGDLNGWDWSAGSTYMAQNLTSVPAAVIVVDMVGDAEQQLYYERNSDSTWNERLWGIAKDLGYARWFIAEPKYAMTDDHTPFLQRGIPALDIIDFDYPYWHTTQDTADKVSPASLERVGRVLEVLLEGE